MWKFMNILKIQTTVHKLSDEYGEGTLPVLTFVNAGIFLALKALNKRNFDWHEICFVLYEKKLKTLDN